MPIPSHPMGFGSLDAGSIDKRAAAEKRPILEIAMELTVSKLGIYCELEDPFRQMLDLAKNHP